MKYDQSFCKAVGEWGCYALCIVDIAEKVLDIHLDKLSCIELGIKKGYISWNEDNYMDPKNFDVLRPDKFLGMMTGATWSVRRENDITYQHAPDEYIVEKWERNGYGHFARTRDGYNSLQDSKCVNQGKLASLRVFKMVAA